jgi:hypothetical protein
MDIFVKWIKKVIALRKRIKADLYASDFKDTIGLGPLPAKVEAKLFAHRQGKLMLRIDPLGAQVGAVVVTLGAN